MAAELTQEINLGGTIYISSKRASEISGYAQDYIGQLARSGQIEAKRISGLWYILEDSLLGHKEKADQYVPIPPQRQRIADLESSVAFDGRDYVSASRAAKVSGYSSDYVGQLAREDKIPSRQVGNRWYVDREALLEHKKYNDSLLAAVQADSVGLVRDESSEISDLKPEISTEISHFTYSSDNSDLIPTIPEEQIEQPTPIPDQTSAIVALNDSEEPINQIPIRRVMNTTNVDEFLQEQTQVPNMSLVRTGYYLSPIYLVVLFLLLGISGAGYAGYKYYDWDSKTSLAAAGLSVSSLNTASAPDFFGFLAKELIYRR